MGQKLVQGLLRDDVTGALVLADPTEFNKARASSPVATIPRTSITGTQVMSSGTVYGALAIAAAAGTFTKVRFAQGAVATALTALAVGVYDASYNKLTETADQSASVPSANTIFTPSLLAPITVTAGQMLYLAIGSVATTGPGLHGNATGLGTIKDLAPVLGRTFAGWAGGALPAQLTANSSFFLPWIELIP